MSLDPLLLGERVVRPAGALRGTIRVPGDKSISHRAVMLAALAKGTSRIRGFLESEDCICTLSAFEAMGISADRSGDELTIHGKGIHHLQEPEDVLNMGNSGTGTRLLLGILAGQEFSATLTGDSSLRVRPMRRVTEPLREMGAQFIGRDHGNRLPLSVQGGKLKPIEYVSPVASAQIKSCLLLAALTAEGQTIIDEPGPSRDHTERMLKTFGIDMESIRNHAGHYRHVLQGGQQLKACDITVPGDVSSAAFFLVAASIVPESDLRIEGLGMNETRTGIIEVLQEMGADIRVENPRLEGAEPVADLHVRHAPLQGTRVSGDTVVRMIDEFPIFAVAAAFASSPSVVEGAEELRVKESDRITTIVDELGKMGIVIVERPDGFTVQGNSQAQGTAVKSYGDHRIAMSLAVAALAASGETLIKGTAPIATSFPAFFDLLDRVCPGSAVSV